MQRFSEKSLRNWLVIGACFLMVFITLGFCSSTKSLYLAAINAATGIPRSLYSLSDSCRFVTSAVVNLFFGVLISRLGAKRLIAAGFACLILFSLIYSYASNAAVFCLGGCFLGLGLSWTTTTMVGYIVNRICAERRGTVIGLILSANGLGGAAAIQIVSPIINREGDPFSYRSAYRLTALILAVSAVVILAAFCARSDVFKPAGSSAKQKASASLRRIDLKDKVQARCFYCAAVGIFLTGIILQAVNGVSAAHMKDVGLDPKLIAVIFSSYSIALAVCKVLCGILHDRLGLRRVLLISQGAAVAAIALLIAVAPTTSGKIAACAYGALSAMAMPLETIMLPLITMDLFGERSYEKMLGIMVSVNTAGYALSTPLTNLCYDLLGTYIPALIALVFLMAAVIVLLLLAMKDAERIRRVSEGR